MIVLCSFFFTYCFSSKIFNFTDVLFYYVLANRQFRYPTSLQLFSCRLTVTRRVPLVDQELLSPPEHSRSLQVFSEVRSVVFCVSSFVDHCLLLYPFSFGHVCLFFFWPCLSVLLLLAMFVCSSVASDCSFGIFKLDDFEMCFFKTKYNRLESLN